MECCKDRPYKNGKCHEHHAESIREYGEMECCFCNEQITEEEDQFEDYYTIYRGRTPEAEKTFLCFDCAKKIF